MNDVKFLNPVSKSIIINSPYKRVWDVISEPGNIEYCHPFCESNPVERWETSKSVDYINYYNGVKLQRVFTNWTVGQGYELLIGRVNGEKSKVTWRIAKLDESSCKLIITIYPYDVIKYPRYTKPFIFALYVRPMLSRYLSSVLKGIQFYVEQGKPVQKNQFGTHKWFSD